MEIGKVPNNVLREIILNKLKNNRKEILLRPKIGEDCCAVDFGEFACVLSSDPITGAINEIGRLAVHVSCNDVASCGVEPIGLLVTILAPPETTEQDLDAIMRQLCDTASSINVDIIGGHTEISSSVTRAVIVTTAIGKIPGEKLVTTSGALAGDDVILTKSAGMEGTAIIAHDKENELKNALAVELIDNAKRFIENISVVREGIIAGEFGVNSMHDVTEGGVLGAVWEVSEASGVGVRIYKEKIPVENETAKIAELYNINPLKLISSGSMLITCKNGAGLLNKLHESGIKASIIGKVTAEKDKLLVMGSSIEEIEQPESDELYKVI